MSTRRQKSRSTPTGIRVNEVVLNAAQEQLLRAVGDRPKGMGRRKPAHNALRLLENQLDRGRLAEAVRIGIHESISLARMRGEQVEVSTRPETRGRVRIRSRDGLETLEGTGAITPVQYRAGMLYRNLYEATDPERDLRSQMTSPALAGAGARTTSAGEAWAERRLRLARSIAILEDKVRVADRNDRGVRALREVAGHARCISHFVPGGGSQAAYRRALVVALDVCAAHFGLA